MVYISRTWTIDVVQSFENAFQNKARLNLKAVVKTLAIKLSLSDLMLSDFQYFQFKPNCYDYEGTKSFTERYGRDAEMDSKHTHKKLNGLIPYSGQIF